MLVHYQYYQKNTFHMMNILVFMFEKFLNFDYNLDLKLYCVWKQMRISNNKSDYMAPSTGDYFSMIRRVLQYRFVPKGGTFPTETIMLVVTSSGSWEPYTQTYPNRTKTLPRHVDAAPW